MKSLINRIGGNRDSLNPYRVGLKLIYDRLLWDFSYQSYTNRKKLKKLSNIYKGKKQAPAAYALASNKNAE